MRTDPVNVATPGSADRQVKGSLAMSAFGDEQWLEFFARLAELRPDVEIGDR